MFIIYYYVLFAIIVITMLSYSKKIYKVSSINISVINLNLLTNMTLKDLIFYFLH